MLIAWAEIALAEPELEERLAEVAPLRSSRIAADPGISAAEYARVAAGETITGLRGSSGAKQAYGAAIVDVGVDALWAAINDETHLVGYTSIAYSEIVRGSPCQSGRHTLQYLPLSLVDDRWWVTVLVANDAIADRSGGAVRELVWSSRVDPAEITSERGREIVASAVPIAYSIGGWLLVRVEPTRTLAEYTVKTDPGGNIPAGMASMFAAGGVKDTIAAVARFAKDGRSICR